MSISHQLSIFLSLHSITRVMSQILVHSFLILAHCQTQSLEQKETQWVTIKCIVACLKIHNTINLVFYLVHFRIFSVMSVSTKIKIYLFYVCFSFKGFMICNIHSNSVICFDGVLEKRTDSLEKRTDDLNLFF